MPNVAAYRIEPDGTTLTPLYLEGVIQPDGTVDPLAGGYGLPRGTVEPPTATVDPFRAPFVPTSPAKLPMAIGAQFKADTTPDNVTWIENATAAPGGGIAQVNDQLTGYSIPMVPADLSDPIITSFRHPSTGAVWPAQGTIRIPTDVVPPAGLDGSITVVNVITGEAWDIYRGVKLSDTSWTSTSVDAIDLWGDGITRGVAAPDNALMFGMWRQWEMRAVRDGLIEHLDHPLRISVPKRMLAALPDPGWQWPAKRRDSTTIVYAGPANGIRMGSYLGIPDEAAALATAGSNIYVRAAVRTLARHGAYVQDQSDYVALYVEPNWKRNPATGQLTAQEAWLTTANGAIKNWWRDQGMSLCRFIGNSTAATPSGGTLTDPRRAPIGPALATTITAP